MEDNNQGNNNRSKYTEEEIDLGQIFSLIGKGFSNLFGFFGGIIISVFNWVVSFILIVRRNFILLTISSIIGLLLGFVYQNFYYVPKYKSEMMVKPNFGSTIQLYKSIGNYQNLISQKNYSKLSEILSVSEDDAKNLVSFEVGPYENSNQSVKAYGKFLASLDTMVVKNVEFEDFIANQPAESFELHIIEVKSKDKFIFSKLETPIISSVSNNEFYKLEQIIAYDNLISEKESIESSIIELDTLRILNKEIMIRESEKEASTGTNIYMASKKNQNQVTYEDYKPLNKDLSKVNRDIMASSTTINVVSAFDNIGKVVGKWFISFGILGFFTGFSLAFGFVSLLSINRILGELEKKRKMKNN